MKAEYRDVLMKLREEGHAVIVWTPDELGSASAKRVEERSVELGFEVIEQLDEVGHHE